MRRTISAAVAVTATLGLAVSAAAGAATATAAQGVSGNASGPNQTWKDKYKDKAANVQKKRDKKVTQTQRDAAAATALQQGALNPLMMGVQATVTPIIDGAPHYFSHPNYANSPLPTVEGAVIAVGNDLKDRAYATDYPVGVGELAPVLTVLPQKLPDGMLQSFRTWNQTTTGGSPFPSAGNVFHAYVLRPTAAPDEYTVVFDSGLLTVPEPTDPAGEVATFGVGNLAVQAGDRLAFYGQGVPVDTGVASDDVSYPAQTPPLQDSTIVVGSTDYPRLNQARTYSFGAEVLDLSGQNTVVSGGLRKFVDELPMVGTDIPVAEPDTSKYPGSNYYEIALVEYEQQMHSDLKKPTRLRGYVQLKTGAQTGAGVPLVAPNGDPILLPSGDQAVGVTKPSYLGPAIVTDRDKPVRILFRNLLPTGEKGDLFIPTDTTVMGSGLTPDGHVANPSEADPQNPICSDAQKATLVAAGDCYPDNRASMHLHGGITPWISDGTPHQWITPAGEDTPYPKGVSVQSVPDMGEPGPGEQTFFYTNAQSARLMFYHDHAWGITRLNVYAGEAAPYIITDDTDKKLVSDGLLPAAEDTIPLVVQDKTFVPSQAQLDQQDELWDTARWGKEGDLWEPHVYSPAQNPADPSGVNAFGRWAYGPWFWPPTNSIEHGPTPNPYYDPSCDPDLSWCEPPEMPGTPFVSMGMESFNDTPVVNGMAYPTVTLDPKSYRLRFLNAANDRFFNLSLYTAVDANGVACDKNNPDPAPESTGVACTEVALDPAEVAAALDDPAGVFPTPLAQTKGPSWIQIGNDGGFLPEPVQTPAQPTTWVTDPTVFNAGNVDKHSLLIAPAERHDVVVDLSQYAGQTLIVYNDAPAAFPARDPRYDYYTGNPDLRDTGGAPSTLPGYGPNTRTVMQIKVADTTPAAPFDLAALEAAFKHQQDGSGVFESGQNPIVVGQGEYNSAYGTSFQSQGPRNGTVQIYDTSLDFDTVSGKQLTMPLRPKMIQDEMGEAFEHDYGRMSGYLGVETPNAQAGQQNMILEPYTSPPTEIIDGVEREDMTLADGSPLPPEVDVAPIASADDGTQIWKFTHNGVDTHPIHFHLYDVQLLNRVGWDGIVRKPDPSELGWKDTVRVSPLEDTIVALRPIIPPIPPEWNGLPNSIRLLDPSMPEGAMLASGQGEATGLPVFSFSPSGEPVDIVNHMVNFGWEYVLHCHILSHEEMDMMHAQSVGVKPSAPTGVTFVRAGKGNNQRYDVTWTDTSKNETGFVVERRPAGSQDQWTPVATVQSSQLGVTPYVETGDGPGTGPRSYADQIGRDRTDYEYQVYAINVVGDVWDYSDPAINNIPPGGGFPTLTLDSRGGSATTIPAPTGLTGNAVAKNRKSATVTLGWTDNSTDETGFLVQRADNAGFTLNVVNTTVAGNVQTFSQDVARGRTFHYRVLAFNDAHQSDWSNTVSVTTP